MRIEGQTIIFKSLPELYHKEKNGLKCNTTRTINRGDYNSTEYKEFMKFMQEFNTIPDKKICIVNAVTEESFTRRLTDISPFESHFILSWEQEI